MKTELLRYRLVYAITIHPDLGNAIEAFKVKLNADDSFTMTFGKITSQSINEDEYEVNAVDHEIIQILSEYTENSIVDQFAKKSRYFTNFRDKEWTDLLFEKKIRPYIERRLVKVIKLILKNNIPLYFKGDRNEFFNERPVNFQSKPAEVFFNFVRTEEEIQYFINIHQGDQQISLLDKRFCILTYKPSFVLIDNDFLSFKGTVNSRKILPFFTKEHVTVARSFEKKYFETFIKATIQEQANVHCEGFDLEIIKNKPVAMLGVGFNLDTSPSLQLSFRYADDVFGIDNGDVAKVEIMEADGQYRVIKNMRDFEVEQSIIKELEKLGLKKKEEFIFVPEDMTVEVAEDIIGWLNKYADELAGLGIEIKREIKKKSTSRAKPNSPLK